MHEIDKMMAWMMVDYNLSPSTSLLVVRVKPYKNTLCMNFCKYFKFNTNLDVGQAAVQGSGPSEQMPLPGKHTKGHIQKHTHICYIYLLSRKCSSKIRQSYF